MIRNAHIRRPSHQIIETLCCIALQPRDAKWVAFRRFHMVVDEGDGESAEEPGLACPASGDAELGDARISDGRDVESCRIDVRRVFGGADSGEGD